MQKNRQLKKFEIIENNLNEMEDYLMPLVNLAYTISGYHKHKGEWRKSHGRNSEEK